MIKYMLGDVRRDGTGAACRGAPEATITTGTKSLAGFAAAV